MNTVLLFLFACAFLGLFSKVNSRKGYVLSLIGGGMVAGVFLMFPSLM